MLLIFHTFACNLQVQKYNITCNMQVENQINLMKEIKKRSDCPISCSLDIWGDKWSLLIIRDLFTAKECTYSDFLKSPERIATNILASRLHALEENELIVRTEHPDSKVKMLYKLTPKGIDLLPILIEMNLWAEKYYSIPAVQKELLIEVKKDKEKYIRKTTKALKESAIKSVASKGL